MNREIIYMDTYMFFYDYYYMSSYKYGRVKKCRLKKEKCENRNSIDIQKEGFW